MLRRATDASDLERRRIAADLNDSAVQRLAGVSLYYLAGCHARLGGIAGTAGSGLSAADVAAELDRAKVVLRRAVAAGDRQGCGG